MDVNLKASDSQGSRPFFNDAVTTAVQIKATRGNLYLLSLVNTTAAAAYLQIFFRPSAAVTLGTTVPDLVIRLLASADKTIVFSVPVGATLATGTPGTGLTIAGTTTPGGLTGAAVSVSALFA